MKKILLILCLLSLSLFAQKKTISVTIEPQKYIIEKIAKTNFKVRSIFKGSKFQIKFRSLVLNDLLSTDFYMVMGLDMEEQFLSHIKTIESKIEVFDMSKDVKKSVKNGKENPYIWMDPLKVRTIAQTVFLKLSDIDPKNRTFYQKNYENFAQELDDLYVKIKLNFMNSSFSVYTMDDYWEYYLKRFDFPMYKVEKRILEAKEITPFIKESKERNTQVLIVDHATPLKVTKSIATNATASVIYSDIFNYSFVGDLFLLSEKIAKK